MRQFLDNLTGSPCASAAWGILLGALVTYVLTAVSESRRQRNERQAKLLEEGLQHCVTFLTAADWLRGLRIRR
jgi:hypothetical protein